jgi:hypothetical protein
VLRAQPSLGASPQHEIIHLIQSLLGGRERVNTLRCRWTTNSTQGGQPAALRRPVPSTTATISNYLDGEADPTTGYRFIKEAGLSGQGQTANPAWKTIYHLVKTLGFSLDVVFAWEDKPKAAIRARLAG